MDGQITGAACGVSATEEARVGQGISLSPNPSNGLVKLEILNEISPTRLKVYDLNGRQVLAKDIPLGQRMLEWQVGDWMPGFYWVELSNEDEKWQAKLVVF
jgi:hypothetical protein